MPYNSAADSFHTKKLSRRFSSREVLFVMAEAEALQANIGSKSGFHSNRGRLTQSSGRRGRSHQPFIFSEN